MAEAETTTEPTEVAPRPWLDELTARYGEPRVHVGPTPMGRMASSDGPCARECWVWFPEPDHRNHSVALDHYAGHWMILASGFNECGHAARARVCHPGSGEPPAPVVRAALVTAGLLPAPGPRTAVTLTGSERSQVEEARTELAGWDASRSLMGATDSAHTQPLRNLLAVLDRIAPKGDPDA